ncbi:MAG: arginine--tRNA ligase [Minisyncoccia bacterium]
MKEEIIQKIIEILKESGVKDPKVVLDYPTHIEMGDYSTNVAMVYAKELGKKPLDLAENIKSQFVEDRLPQTAINIARPGFLNFFFDANYFKDEIGKKFEGKIFKGQKIFFEHSQPNPFKEFHIGHLMGNCIGESVSRILKANGAEIQVASYHGDVGLHIAMAVWAIKAGKNLEVAYAFGYKEFEENEKAKVEILEINKKIYEESDPEISEIYEDGRQKSLEGFEALYKRLDSHFDFHFFESESGEIGQELVRENIGRIFEKGDPVRNGDSKEESVSNGIKRVPIIFKGENFEPKTHTRVFLNSEGLPTYEAKELGLAQIKKDWFDYDKSITVTANEQDSFFKVVEVAIGEVFPELKRKLHHLSHGILKLPSGKMSSRTGTIISAEDLIDQVKTKVLDKMKNRDEMPRGTLDIEELAEIVAIGAIKYSILRQAIGGDIVFDFEKSISFEGDSGPYLQYSAVRANSILKKVESTNGAGDTEAVAEVPENWKTTNLERYLERFFSVVEKAGREYAPHYLVTYLTELAGEFNSFYASGKIIDENDPVSSYKLYITKAFAQVMTDGLSLLAIKVPEKM